MNIVRLHIVVNLTSMHSDGRALFKMKPFTLLCSIVLVGLTVPLPYVAINVIKVVRGNIGNAVEVEEVGLCGQSAEHRQQPPHEHGGRGRSEAA